MSSFAILDCGFRISEKDGLAGHCEGAEATAAILLVLAHCRAALRATAGSHDPRGETMADLQENLKDLYEELTRGQIPGARRVAKLRVACGRTGQG